MSHKVRISIHALFAEGDDYTDADIALLAISIHALFAEGDPASSVYHRSS